MPRLTIPIRDHAAAKGAIWDGPRSAGGYLGVSTIEDFLCCRAAVNALKTRFRTTVAPKDGATA
jgi:hypothetical protein